MMEAIIDEKRDETYPEFFTEEVRDLYHKKYTEHSGREATDGDDL